MGLERDFEKFTGGPAVSTRERMDVTLSALGVIYFNQNTYRMWGKPEAVELYYSGVKDTIAIKPGSPRIDENFPVKKCQNGWRILAGPFVGHNRIRTDKTLRFVRPEIDDSNILLLNMRGTVNVTARQDQKKKKDA
jgi:hypothetical protein